MTASTAVVSTRVGIVTALEPEAAPLRRRLRLHYQGETPAGPHWQGQVGAYTILLLRCGMGQARAAQAAAWCVQQPRMRGILSVGFAGGLQAHLTSGDAVLVTEVVSASAGRDVDTPREGLKLDVGLMHAVTLAAAQTVPRRHSGPLLSLSGFVPQASDKQRLGRRRGVLAVDMESYSIARLAMAHRLPCAVLRIIVDTCDDDLPLSVSTLTTPDGALRPLGLLRELSSHPGLARQLPTLWRQSRRAGQRLAAWLHRTLTLLAPPADGKGMRP